MLESISIDLECKEGGAAWGVVCGVPGGYLSRAAMSALFFVILFSFTYM